MATNTKKPIDYSKGKVYKIWSPSTDKIYIGSTTKEYLSQRLTAHMDAYNKWMKGKPVSNMTSFQLLKLKDYKIELIELFPCNTRDELLAREGYYQRLFKDSIVNKVIADRTTKEYQNDNKDSIKKRRSDFYLANKDRLTVQKKLQYHQNRIVILEKAKQYREHNKEKIRNYVDTHKEQIRQWYSDNKNRIQEKNSQYIQCECGSHITRGYQSHHQYTKKHKNYIASIE